MGIASSENPGCLNGFCWSIDTKTFAKYIRALYQKLIENACQAVLNKIWIYDY